MTGSAKQTHAVAGEQEKRALDADELSLANQARHPDLESLSDAALSDVISRLRSRRNRARDIADRQGREARAKSSPSGVTPASGNAGTQTKHDYLNAALARAIEERRARGGAGDDDADAPEAPSQHDIALKAMALKKAGAAGPNPMLEDGGPLHPDDPEAGKGKGGLDDTARRTAPSGALDHAGELPSRERSRTRY